MHKVIDSMISVIVPIYKVEKYLPRCIESLMGQTHQDIEIILVDDGSPDRCPIICDEYVEKDSRIRVIHKKNAGVSAARNDGLRIAGGEYIGFCDPDDWADPKMFEELLIAIESNKADLAICGYNYYDESYQVDMKRLYKEKTTECIDQKTLFDRMADMPPTIRHGVVNKLFRKDLLQGICFDSKLKSSEDLKFLIEYIGNVELTVIVHQPLYQNLVRTNSATHGGLSIDSLLLSYDVHEKMYHMAIDKYAELKPHALAYLLDVLTLKYFAAKRRLETLQMDQRIKAKRELDEMRKRIKRYSFAGLFDQEIYWKTRMYYILMR